MGNQQERSLAWLAGVLDGEGSITVQVYTLPDGRVRLTPFVAIANSDDGVLEECARIIEESGFRDRRKSRNGKTSRAGFRKLRVAYNGSQRTETKVYQLRLDGQEPVEDFLNLVLPYLRSSAKTRAAKVILQYLEGRRKRLLERDALGRIQRAGYTRDEIELICSIRTHSKAKSSEAICQAPNVIG